MTRTMVNFLRVMVGAIDQIDRYGSIPAAANTCRRWRSSELCEVISQGALSRAMTSYAGQGAAPEAAVFLLQSASVQYAVKDFMKVYGPKLGNLPGQGGRCTSTIRIPAVAIPELMRILMDELGPGHGPDAEGITPPAPSPTRTTPCCSEALETLAGVDMVMPSSCRAFT